MKWTLLACSITCFISSALMGSALASLNNRFSRTVRNARTSARMVCLHVWGLAAFNKTSCVRSLIVCSSARASDLAYSSSMPFVLMDFVRSVAIEVTQ